MIKDTVLRLFSTIFLIFLSFPLLAEGKTVPLLLSEHHVDHMEFFFRHGVDTSATMIVLDAHLDTVTNKQGNLIRGFAAAGSFSMTGELAGNHDWIQPLAPSPLGTLVWISTIRGSPENFKLQGSVETWDILVRTETTSIEELRFLEPTGETLFISVDLDFFSIEDHYPEDVPAVLNSLFSFSSRWLGPSVWAVCISRPWLPDDRYAWLLLEKTLDWLCSRPEFRIYEKELFDSRRVDTSRTAQMFCAEGREMPVLRETDAPEYIKTLIREIRERKLSHVDG